MGEAAEQLTCPRAIAFTAQRASAGATFLSIGPAGADIGVDVIEAVRSYPA